MKFNLLTIFWNCACAYIPQLVNFITPLNFLCAGCTLTLLRSAGERSVVRTLSTAWHTGTGTKIETGTMKDRFISTF